LSLNIGCSGSDKGDGEKAEEQVPSQPPADTSWVFNSAEHGFSLTLPSSDWKKSTRKRFLADFYSFWNGSPMLAAVVAVRKQTPEEFHQTVAATRAKAGEQENLLSPPSFHEEETGAGDRRAFLSVYEKGGSSSLYLFAARSFVWLKDKGITVELLFEGQGKMQSKLFQLKEKERSRRRPSPSTSRGSDCRVRGHASRTVWVLG
jgi:hypothetical protein